LTGQDKPAGDSQPRESDKPLVARGRKLARQHRCAACHRMGAENVASDVALGPIEVTDAAWKKSCVGSPRGLQPGYHLEQSEADAVRKYLAALSHAKTAGKADEPDAALLIARNNCLSCHARGLQGGIAERLPAVAERHGVLASLLPAMAPPALDGVGDKLTRNSLTKAIRRDGPPLRGWLVVRMPKFRLSDEQLGAIADHLIAADRVFDRPTVETKQPSRKQLLLAGAKLVTSQGFGCASCHSIGRRQPSKDSLAARGPNLSMLGQRIRRTWFDRFVRNPSRIVPRMEMPTIALAARGHLGDNLDHQLAAVWEVLNQRGFEPPASSVVRVARTAAIPGRSRRAIVLTDVLKTPGRQYVKPLLIALPNRHNVLFDLETSRLAGWWTGDAAVQRTEGKTWFWEVAGSSVGSLGGDGPELSLGSGDKLRRPLRQSQHVSEFDSLEHLPGGLRFRQRLHFAPQRVVAIEQTFTSQWPQASASGFARTVRITGAPANEPIHLRIVASEGLSPSNISKDARRITLPGNQVSIVLSGPKTARFVFANGAIHVTDTIRRADVAVEFKLLYLTNRPVPPFAIDSTVRRANQSVDLAVAPGFRVTRLPLPEEIMPTGLAWRGDGTLVISSLKGRVWLAHDRNGDGLEDYAAPFSDELAAPYGVATQGEAIDVITKSALLRLFDDDRDGRADRTVTLASGWGHTADYHDWTVGLVSDPAGNYYVALPCQQDQRTGAAAYLRGTVLKLAPRRPDRRDPRPFAIEPLTAGHRFPMGLARNRRGDLFVTDNQGNWNPFNELNHVVAKAHYGFINANDLKKDLKLPTRPAAIEIPHPWTRSVNGICFLDTPQAVRKRLGRDLFGPLEGHLIGCEYDTRRLVRMSLQRVGETYQGACYPFSVEPLTGRPGLLGPLVCSVAPDGDLYVGCIREGGWGGGQNVGTIVRLRPTGDLPCGIAEVRADAEGFIIVLTAPADARRAADAANYVVSSYRRQSTPAYGGKDQDRRDETIESVTVSEDRRRIKLRLRRLRAGFVYDLRLKNLAGDGKQFFPAEAYYTLRTIPK
ncbi:MAG: hypothetical protein IIA67_10480, partial [Planctomycetes bacterium]|nr:hypothetical protein [Planctomycetota bacterium]